MSVAVADAFRSIKINGATIGTVEGTASASSPGSQFTLTSGIGIALVADPATNSVSIVNTGSGSGAFTTINDTNNNQTYYPLFTRAPGPGDFDALSGQYHMDTVYLDQTTDPLTYNPSNGTLNAITFNGNVTATSVGTSTLTATSTALVGSTANFTDWPNAKLVSSQANTGDSHPYNMGIVGEAVANSGDTARWGVGVYGKGSTNSGTRSAGVLGDGGVTNSSDGGSAIGVRGYATDTHAGGFNIGLYAEASGSSTGNYALAMNTGDILSLAAQTWTLVDNNLSALSVDAAGKTGILAISTVNTAEGVSMSGTLSVTGHVTLEGVTSTGATGTGNLVFSGSPSLTSPTLGVASATSINKVVLTAPSTAATITIADTKTFTVNNTITLDGTDLTTITLPASSGTVALNNQGFYVGTTSLTINRASSAQSLTGITSIDGYAAGLAGGNSTTLLGALPYQSNSNTTSLLGPNTTTTKKFLRMTGDGTNGAVPAWDTIGAADLSGTLPSTVLGNSSLYVGTTSIALNRASASQSLTGITSIDGYSAGLAGGNNTTLLGSLPYQSAANTTSLLSPNTTTTKKFLRMTGDGTNGAAPDWDTLASGDIPNNAANTSGYAGSLSGGNSTTLLGSIPYQSNTNVTSLLSPNVSTARKFLRQTGTGLNGAAPAWDTLLAADVPTLNQDTTGSAGSVANALTISTGLQLNSGTTYNGSAARTLSIDSTVATLTGIQTLTNKRVTPRPNVTLSGSGSFSFNTDSMDHISLTGINGSITLSVTGTPTEGQRLMIKLKDDGTARGITWTTTAGQFRAVGLALPSTTVAGRVMYIGAISNNTDGYWDVVSIAQY